MGIMQRYIKEYELEMVCNLNMVGGATRVLGTTRWIVMIISLATSAPC